jgi:pyrroline-5-carboxylate reductase
MLNEDTKEYLKEFIRQTIIEQVDVVLNAMRPVMLAIVMEEINNQRNRGHLISSMDLDMLVNKLRHEFAENLQQTVTRKEFVRDDYREKLRF